jgi:hypothetical protein
MSRCADDRAAEVSNSETQRQDELALVHEAFAEEHEAAAEELSGDLADATAARLRSTSRPLARIAPKRNTPARNPTQSTMSWTANNALLQ